MYATTGGDIAGAVYFSPNAGNMWYNIGTALPNVPMNTVVIDPNDTNLIFVGTDVGLFRGTHSGGTPGTWAWCAYNVGLPKTALVKGLAVHRETGTLRAFTYGRSAWEVKAFGVADIDTKVNVGANPVTDVQPPLISSNFYGGGSRFGVAWRDDRNGANNWRAYFRAYTNTGGSISAINATEVLAALGSQQIESLAFSAHPTLATSVYCGRFAWHDKRLNGVNPHVFSQYTCSDGWTLWTDDLRVDTHALSSNAKNPAIVTQNGGTNLDFAVAWEFGNTTRKIYGRFFTWAGTAKSVPTYGTNSFPVSTSALDATAPAIAGNSTGEVIVAWQERASASSDYIYARKYTRDGVPLTAAVRIDSGAIANRGEVSIGFDSNNKTVIAWSEATTGQPRRVISVGCPASSGLTCYALDGSCRRCVGGSQAGVGCASDGDCSGGVCGTAGTVSCGPRIAQVGSETAQFPSVAADGSANVVVTWQGSPTDGSANPKMNAMAKSFNVWALAAKSDFRVDRADRADVRSPVATRGAQAKEFVYAWRDNRAGHFDVYLRKVASLP